MAEEDTRAVCTNCESIDWSTENVLNTTSGGIIQAQCNECGHKFEINVGSTSSGWSTDAVMFATQQIEWGEQDPEL